MRPEVRARLEEAVALRATDPAWQRRTMWNFLTEVGGREPDHPFAITCDTTGREAKITYAQLIGRSGNLSTGLADIGVRRGDRVGLWMTNLAEWLYTYFACLRIGATVVPVSTWLKPREVEHILATSAVRHLVMLDRFRKISFPDQLDEIAPEWRHCVPGRLKTATLPDLRNVVLLNREGGPRHDCVYDFETLLEGREAAGALADELAAEVQPDDLALVKFTSGSTGFPKGVMLQHWGLVTVGQLHSRRIGMTSNDRFFSQMPFFHGGGSIWGLMTMLAQGGTLVFTETNDGETAAKLIVENECTATMGVPPNFYGMFEVMDREQQRITSVRAAASGGQLLKDMRERLGPVEFTFSPYGMTELYGPAVLTDVDDSEELRAEGWIRPLDGQEMRVIDPATGDDVEPGGIGEIRMRGLAMLGYYHLPQQTATTIDPDGWVHSEDLVAFREGGYIRYVGRMKAMLKVGGENVAVEEVEGIVRAFPGVVEACVIGVPDAKKGELPRAYVVPAKDATIDRDELDAFCSERLARYKVPRDYLIVESIPMTGSGKPDRAAIIAQDAEAAGLEHIQA